MDSKIRCALDYRTESRQVRQIMMLTIMSVSPTHSDIRNLISFEILKRGHSAFCFLYTDRVSGENNAVGTRSCPSVTDLFDFASSFEAADF